MKRMISEGKQMEGRSIVLTGFMGTGKSTIGRLLAARTGRHFIDTDEQIEQRAGKTIAQIFAEEGSAAFRQQEAALAQELARQRGLVIATGGRLMLDEANAAALGTGNLVLCLSAPAETIVARVLADGTRRPLLEVPDPAGRVADLLAERAEGYGQYPQIETDGRAPAEVVAEIVSTYRLAAPVVAASARRLPVRYPGGAYEVVVGNHLLSELRGLAELGEGAVAVITDDNVGPLYAGQLGEVAGVFTIPAGEQHKTLDTVRSLYEQLLAAGIDRRSSVVALGGGVVGDVTGFVAATYMRGIRFVQCPTTLLAMVDASVGGKTGVDLPQGKNLVGAFKQPVAVLADVSTLHTLPPAEFAAGMAEVVKHGLIAAPSLLADIERSADNDVNLAALQEMIARAIAVKRDVVEEDPFEKGRRAVLNLGHTFGHAIEQVSGYTVRHGEGVAMGLVAAANLSARLGLCRPALQRRIEALLGRLYLPTRIPAGLATSEIIAAMSNDKKKAAGNLRFILIRAVGDVFVSGDVPEEAVAETLEAVRA